MALPATTPDRMTVSEYLALEETSRDKHEFRDGQRIMMAGGTFQHGVIAINIARAFGNRLVGGPCTMFDSTVKIRPGESARFVYPDAGVVCGTPQFAPEDPHQTTILNPRLVIEILSPSTEAYDRGDKFTSYREATSLREYVLVSQTQPHVETFYRRDTGEWVFNPAAGLDAVVRLQSLGIEVPLSEIYAGINFPTAVETPGGDR